MTGVAVIELAVVCGAALPAVRIAVDRRLDDVAPRLRAAAAAAVIGAAAFGAVLVVAAPAALHVAAVAAAVAAGFALVRARPGYGRRRGWPPGSLSVTRSVCALGDRATYRAGLARHGPVFKTAQMHQPTVCIAGLERGHRLLRDQDHAITSAPLPFSTGIPGGFLRYMDADTHALYGPLFRRALAPSIVQAAEPATRAAARRELLRAAADAEQGRVTPSVYTTRLVHDAFLRCLFGIEPGSAATAEFDAAYVELGRQDIAAPLSAGARDSVVSLRALVVRLVDERPDTASAAHELRRLGADQPDLTALDNLLFTQRISTGNVVGLLDWAFYFLGRNPEWIERLRSEPAGGQLADRIVMETLRLGQSEYVYRTLTAPVEFEGYRLPAGWLVRLCVAESHLDPDVHPDPARYDPDRFLQRHDSTQFSPFGWGRHLCNGVTLTHMIARVALEELTAGYTWGVVGGDPPTREPRHWRHWRPAGDLSVQLSPRVAGQKP